MQENINIPDSTITTNLSFRNLVLMNMQQLTNFPYIEKDFDALTDYELLCLVVKYLNDVIANQNEQNDSITRMYNAFLSLQEYVNTMKDDLETAFNNLNDYVRDYFENLDVQDEINNKLDEMLEDGSFTELFSLMYPVKTGETNVVNAFFPYGDIKRYGGKCDGVTDDTTPLNNAITNALLFNFPVYIHGLVYTTETVNTHGVQIIGDKQPVSSGGYYPNGIGFDYAKNMNDGYSITFRDYINTIVDGTAIISDVANPILSTDWDKGFNLSTFGVYGWLRNYQQEGLKVNQGENITYYPGRHFFNNFSVFNTGSNGIHLYSLEVSTVNHLIIELTNGYGLYIEGLTDTDCPTDYTIFNDCRFRYTRLAAFYSKNSYRQECEFDHCNFNYIGQNAFGVCNDPYGERTQPTTIADIVYAIDIDGYNYVYGTPTRGLNIMNCYGEQLNGLLTIHNVTTFNNLKMNSSSIVRSIGSSVSCYANIDVRYLLNLDVDYTPANVTNVYNLVNISQIISKGFLPNQFSTAVTDITKLFNNNTKDGYKSYKAIYGDDTYSKNYILSPYVYHGFNTASGSETTVSMDLKDLIDEHFKYFFNNGTTGRPYSLGLISLPASSDTSTPAVADLVAITKHNSKYFITFLTSNTGATATTDGVVSITVPAWKVATFQFIQQIDNSIQ